MYALSARLLHLAFQGSACAHKLCGIPQHEAVEALCGDSTEGFSLRGRILMGKSLGYRFFQRDKITW